MRVRLVIVQHHHVPVASQFAPGGLASMITIRKSSARGRADLGWARSAHTFSFGDYFAIAHQGHGSLYVLNEDAIAPGRGFPMHGHREVEIVSYVLAGELAHRDDVQGASVSGKESVLRPGDVQRITAGTGLSHSEFNHLADRSTHFLQMWFQPLTKAARPAYEQKHFAEQERRGRLALVVSPAGVDGSLGINADVCIEAGLFEGVEHCEKQLDATRLTYVHLARGELQVNGQLLAAGDGALLEAERMLSLAGGRGAEILVFDLTR
jgi:redox-sensitive bicupin YhaK (pirin superfamily)